MAIFYKKRNDDTLHEEKIAKVDFLKWLNESHFGNLALENIVKKKIFSILVGKYYDMSFSKSKIERFVKKYNINMTEVLREKISDYVSFNDFFTRKLKAGSREIVSDPNVLVSPADSKLLVDENVNINKMMQIKGSYYTLAELLIDEKKAKEYANGCCLVFRLSPTDYHRFHFPDSGKISNTKKIRGDYYSVNPISLNHTAKVFCKNKRDISTLDSDNFGEICMIEVGASCVGTIVQTYESQVQGNKGDEKGYFEFGGSTVILLLKEGTVEIDKDIIRNSAEGIETQVSLGEKIGVKGKKKSDSIVL